MPLVRQNVVEILARDAKSAEAVVNACATLAGDIKDAAQSEQIGPAVAI